MIHKYCKNIRSLDIEISEEQSHITFDIQSICSKLKELHIHFPQTAPLVYDFISACTELEELEIGGFVRVFPDGALPNLTKLKISCYIRGNGLKRFLA